MRINQTKRQFNFRSVTRRSFLFLDRALEEEVNMKTFKEKARQFVNCYDDLDRNQKYRIYDMLFRIYRASSQKENYRQYLSLDKVYHEVLRAIRRTYKEQMVKDKQNNLRAMLDAQDIVFFACSIHAAPAEDHKDWQGVIFVDRFWRTKVRGYTYRAVEAYVRNHQTKTVQEIVGAPVYLTTRPYCKHFFVPLETNAVLRSSPRKIAEGLARVSSTVEFDRNEYYNLRSSVYNQLNQMHPCKEYRSKIRF